MRMLAVQTTPEMDIRPENTTKRRVCECMARWDRASTIAAAAATAVTLQPGSAGPSRPLSDTHVASRYLSIRNRSRRAYLVARWLCTAAIRSVDQTSTIVTSLHRCSAS
jgi:hypothetical protein